MELQANSQTAKATLLITGFSSDKVSNQKKNGPEKLTQRKIAHLDPSPLLQMEIDNSRISIHPIPRWIETSQKFNYREKQ